MPKLYFDRPDTHGFKMIDFLPLIGLRFQHTGNDKIYEIENFAWLGDTDEWLIIHREIGIPIAACCARTYDNFFGEREPGIPRFKKFVDHKEKVT